jgi:hypothetical protein
MKMFPTAGNQFFSSLYGILDDNYLSLISCISLYPERQSTAIAENILNPTS